MIITRFLAHSEYSRYGDWLKSQSQETINLYFGIPYNEAAIDALVDKIISMADEHEFLVAEDHGRIIGCVHIAGAGKEVELGIIVHEEYRGEKLGSRLLGEAIIHSRNRGYKDLYMHCLSWNQPIRHLCTKHGLSMTNMYGESEVKVKLPPANLGTILAETNTRNRQIWGLMLQNMGIPI